MSEAGPTLLTTPAFILGEFIIDQAIGSMTDPDDGLNLPLYISYTPDDSDNSVKTDLGVLYDTTPVKDGRLMIGPVIAHYGIQLKIRSQKHTVGYAKAEEIAAALDAITNGTITINTEDYIIQNISRTGPPIPLGPEKGTTNRRLRDRDYLQLIL